MENGNMVAVFSRGVSIYSNYYLGLRLTLSRML